LPETQSMAYADTQIHPTSFHFQPHQDLLTGLKEEINSNPCVIFSKTTCPACTRAKAALANAGAKVFTHELDGCDDLKSMLTQLTGVSTVPQVFVGGQYIGGGIDTQQKAQSGELRSRLRYAKALL